MPAQVAEPKPIAPAVMPTKSTKKEFRVMDYEVIISQNTAINGNISIKAQQEQKLQELAQNTEAVQKQLAMLHKIETQVREQMKKSGMELPGKSELTAKKGGKGGPSKKKISNLVVLR